MTNSNVTFDFSNLNFRISNLRWLNYIFHKIVNVHTKLLLGRNRGARRNRGTHQGSVILHLVSACGQGGQASLERQPGAARMLDALAAGRKEGWAARPSAALALHHRRRGVCKGPPYRCAGGTRGQNRAAAARFR